jgi:putative ABC transport system substrate-binding protein
MRRREFLGVLGGAAAAWPIPARAQLGERLRRIGWLSATEGDDPLTQIRLAALRRGLEPLGWIAGRNVQIQLRT